MKHISYKTNGTCAKCIEFDLVDDKIKNIAFSGGCNGNLKAISKICDGMPALKVMQTFEGNLCGTKQTSCADQLSLAIRESLQKQ